MDLNFKNVARYLADTIHSVESGGEDRTESYDSLDSFSSIYLLCSMFDMARGYEARLGKKDAKSEIMNSSLIKAVVLLIQNIHYPEVLDLIFQRKIDPELPFELKCDIAHLIPCSTEDSLVAQSVSEFIFEHKIPVSISALNEHLPEIINNARIHPIEPSYFFKCNYSKTGNYFDIAIGDIGLGIKGTLSKKAEYSYLKDKPAMHSIIKAFEPMVTSKNEPRGTGLSEAHDYFMEHPTSVMYLSSNDGYYLIEHENGKPVINAGNLKYNLSGVQILLRFGFEK
jgi:hypothetical protein